MFNRQKTQVVTIVLLVFLQILFIFSPLKAQAVLPVTVTTDVPATATEIKKSIGATILGSAMGGVMNGFSYFMRRLAYDSATYVASGGKGQGALAFSDGFGSYLEKVGLDSVATAVEELGKPFGLNLCQTPDLQFQVWLQIGLRSMYDLGLNGSNTSGPQPSCTFQTLKDSWSADAFAEKYGSVGTVIEKTFNNAIRVENSDFGLSYGAMGAIDRNKIKIQDAAQAGRLEGQGYKPLTELITGKVKTPAQIVQEESMAVTKKSQSEMTAGQIAGVYGSASLQIFPQALSIFLNTLVSQSVQNAQEALTGLNIDWFADNEDSKSEETSGVSSYDLAGYQSSRKKAQAAFSDLITSKINSVKNYSVLNEFASCNDDAAIFPGVDNCVMDKDLKTALDRANFDKPLTIKDALDLGLLHKEWPLISPRRISDNMSRNCYDGKYCYSNIQKLRRNRILPLGFEIAALMADPDNPYDKWTLGKVVEGFNDCLYKEVNGVKVVVPDSIGHPYCRLIDPNWVLKEPLSRCDAQVYGPTLLDTNSGLRSKYCADLKTCLSSDGKGNCDANNYGYCTREKNIWRFNAKSCEEQYSTCTGYTNSSGERNYYLSRTVDYGQCALENVGCSSYSTEKVNEKWVESSANIFSFNNYNLNGRNPNLYFNSKIKSFSCGEFASGCSAFYPGSLSSESASGYVNNYNNSELVYIKKAPAYLGCYDFDTTTAKIDWPETKLELDKIKPNAECDKFAQVCLPDEVNCDSYVPKSGEDRTYSIPAVIGNKSCDSSCVGYNVFKQEGTPLIPEEFPLYFIPSKAKICSKEVVGCDEYTNIDEANKGGEGLEYYTKMKYCEVPNGSNESVYYSWEGSKTEGYVLKTHKLRPVDQKDFNYLNDLNAELKFGVIDSVAKVYPVGSPMYNTDSVNDLNLNYSICNENNYNNYIDNKDTTDISNPDCRALYDKNGKIFYRLLSDMIEVSTDCHPLRKTVSNYWEDSNLNNNQAACLDRKGKYTSDNKCLRCLSGGFYDEAKDSCIYWSTGKEGVCSKENNGCRQYTGNQGNNVQILFNLDFEASDSISNSDIVSSWSPVNNVSVSAEALQVTKHSLQISGGGIASLDISTKTNYLEGNSVNKSDWYEVSFWARGTGVNVSLYFEQNGKKHGEFNKNSLNNYTSSTIGYDWRFYNFGPVQFTGENDEITKLVFKSDGGNNSLYFIDKLQLRRLINTNYLIKDSWKTEKGYNVPEVCDNIPEDPYPGEALGCAEYTEESSGTSVYATGFEKLCREKAVGCRAVFDTQNTLYTPYLTIFNAWSDSCVNGLCTITVSSTLEGKTDYKCNAEQNAKGCFVDKIIVPNDVTANPDWFSTSTIIIPEDTPSTTPIFLTTHKKYSCTVGNLGCQLVGAEKRLLSTNDSNAFSHTDTYVLNDPEKYVGKEGILCRNDLVGCEEFKSGNSTYYFKDPVKFGNSFCEYKDKTSSAGLSLKGWFKKEVGRCYDGDSQTGLLCKVDKDCGENKVCKDVGEVPCYNDYLISGGSYGIWSNGNPKYNKQVGLCPAEANNCTELVDPADKTMELYPNGKPYYVIYSSDITANVADCNSNNVSQKKGCVLFNKTDIPNKKYSSALTYKESEKNNFELVFPISSSTINDSNIVLKVQQDRECAEWLACRGYLPVPDTQSENKERNGCYALQPCESGTGFNCTKEITDEKYLNQKLTYDTYITRDISWSNGKDYSGYSLYNQLPVASLNFVNLKSSDIGQSRDKIFLANLKKDNTCSNESQNGATCGSGGICYNEKCVFPATGSFSKTLLGSAQGARIKATANELFGSLCRAYPAENSPFTDNKNTIVDKWLNGEPQNFKDQKYQNSKICQPGENCECNYIKSEYGQNNAASLERYYSYDSKNPELQKGGVCQGGKNNNAPCNTDLDCGEENSGAVCLIQQKRSTYLGWNGYCLERDYSRRINGRIDNDPESFACLTWYPLDYVPGLFDVYYNDPSKGYLPPGGVGDPGKVYCTEASAVSDLNYYNSADDFYYKDNTIEQLVDPEEPTFFSDKQMNCSDLIKSYISSKLDYAGDFWGPYYYVTRFKGGMSGVKNFIESSFDPLCPDNNSKNPCYSLLENSNFDLSRCYGQESIREYNYGLPSSDDDKKVRPLFPKPGSSWYGKTFGSGNDSGLVTNLANKYDDFINKKTAISVGLLPLGFTDAESTPDKENPAYNINHKIVLSGDYPLINGDNSNTQEVVQNRSTLANENSCPFCKWWVLKTEYSENHTNKILKNSEGYLLQWWQSDPLGSENTWVSYSNQNKGYKVNPLRTRVDGSFYVACNPGGEDSGKNWFAVEYLFDKTTGKFKGTLSRFCEGTSDGHTIGTATLWQLRPICLEASQVFDSSGIQRTNKAYTDRLWSGTTFGGVDLDQRPECTSDPKESQYCGYKYKYNNLLIPYGSGSSGLDITYSSSTIPWIFDSEPTSINAGYPWSCNNISDKLRGFCSFDPYSIGKEQISIPQAVQEGNSYLNESNNINPYYEDVNNSLGFYSENSWVTNVMQLNDKHNYGLWKKGTDLLLNNLFAKIFSVRTYKDSQWSVNSNSLDNSDDDGEPPYVYPAVNCEGQECEIKKSDKNNFSVNGVSDANLPNESLFGLGSKFVTLKFFAWANHNQMPIRRIMIDWNNNDSSSIVFGNVGGYYSNYKPYCGEDGLIKECVDGQNKSIGLTCKEPTDCPTGNNCTDIGKHFGNIAGDTCINKPVERYFNYTCDADKYQNNPDLVPPDYVVAVSDTGDEWKKFLLDKGLKNTDLVCVYRPKLQVQDNWGWCTGNCRQSTSGAKGCFEEECNKNSQRYLEFKNQIVIAPLN